MSDLFATLIAPVLAAEGGYSNDPADAGGETNFGVTVAVARANGYAGPMREMTQAQAVEIYRRVYWSGSGFALLAAASEKVAGKLLDVGVNMGVKAATLLLQRALNVLNNGGETFADIPADGSCGPTTAAALAKFITARGAAGELVMLKAINCLQGARYVELAEGRAGNERFVFGWLRARINL